MKAEKSPHCPDADGEKIPLPDMEANNQKGTCKVLMPEHSASFHRNDCDRNQFSAGELKIPELADSVKQCCNCCNCKSGDHKSILPQICIKCIDLPGGISHSKPVSQHDQLCHWKCQKKSNGHKSRDHIMPFDDTFMYRLE